MGEDIKEVEKIENEIELSEEERENLKFKNSLIAVLSDMLKEDASEKDDELEKRAFNNFFSPYIESICSDKEKNIAEECLKKYSAFLLPEIYNSSEEFEKLNKILNKKDFCLSYSFENPRDNKTRKYIYFKNKNDKNSVYDGIYPIFYQYSSSTEQKYYKKKYLILSFGKGLNSLYDWDKRLKLKTISDYFKEKNIEIEKVFNNYYESSYVYRVYEIADKNFENNKKLHTEIFKDLKRILKYYKDYISILDNKIKDFYNKNKEKLKEIPDFNELLNTYILLLLSDDYIEKKREYNKNFDKFLKTLNIDNFKFPQNTILYGPSGTGKTYNSIFYSVGIIEKDKNIIDMIENENMNISDEIKEEIFSKFNVLKKEGQIEFLTFHQSYSYEDFVEGIRPILKNNEEDKKESNEEEKDLKYTLYSGIFKDICERAIKYPDKNYVLNIDEINRGNISKIFGELITLLEPTKRLGEAEELEIRLPYSGEEFGVPKNLYILGTMNTADRSIALLDIALRRRFNFIEMPPRYNLLKPINIETNEINLQELLKAINTRIEILLDKDHLIGHSYFINIKSFEDLKAIFKNSIMPLLQEYFYDDFEKIKFVLNIKDDEDNKDNNSIIRKEKIESKYIPETLPKNFPKSLKNKTIYEINEEALNNCENYTKIYN
ncbi:McrB family protein [Fusobacterium polymorphum]|uniref:McrB family protein n=1 Tax=Fusobacterium nucleatum subsp. polymorphum TaxID=76857 RepID=UPI003008C62F